MSVRPVSATPSSRTAPALAAATPNRFVIRDIMGWAGPALGLKSAVLNTLDVLVSFLPPARDHHMVFASNATILTRAQGLSERTLRRHVQLLQEAGLLARCDSPNRKRFIRRAPDCALRFGLDLGPLFAKCDLLDALATQAREEAATRALKIQELRCACQRRLAVNQDDTLALETLASLRRKLSIDQLDALLAHVAETTEPLVTDNNMTANDGEFDRHHKSLNKDFKIKTDEACETVTAAEIMEACPAAASYCENTPTTLDQITTFAQKMRQSLGLSTALYDRAISQKGQIFVALIICIMLQKWETIRNAPAYFAALTCGRLADQANPLHFIQRQLRKLSADNTGARSLELHAVQA